MEAASSDVFWAQLQSLCSLLAPFAEAVALVQSGTATLADIAIHLLQLANILEAAKTVSVVPAGKARNNCLLGFVCVCTALADPCKFPAVQQPADMLKPAHLLKHDSTETVAGRLGTDHAVRLR